MEGLMLYLKESYNELVHKVTWPSWSNLLSSTRLVIIASAIFATLTLIIDFISKTALTAVYEL